MDTKLDLNLYMKIIRVMIIFLSINILHLITNEFSQKKSDQIKELSNINPLIFIFLYFHIYIL